MTTIDFLLDHGIPAAVAFITLLIGGAVAWTKMQGKVDKLATSIAALAEVVKELGFNVKDHHERTDIHRDPVRDPERHKELLSLIKDNRDVVLKSVEGVKSAVEAINNRCINAFQALHGPNRGSP